MVISDKSCSVFGHRDIEEDNKDLKEKLYLVFEDLITNKNVKYFYFGGFGDFDYLCNMVVADLQKKYPFIKRYYVCDDYKYIDRPRKRPLWLKEEDYDELIYFEMRYKGFYKRIYFRNCEIIEHSDYVVFHIRHQNSSGTFKAFEYAQRSKKEILQV
ncbi:MAG: hypothetical protein E7378_02940 [Clostridiales bacterium]|nr:hypothetical protein [Clostridiales bacterium]